jgi:hypothetical protein
VSEGQGQGWFDQPRNVSRIVWALAVASALTVLADFVHHKHVHYGFEEWPGFHAGFGFVSCVVLVLAAVQLRKVLMRGEDYYDG